DEMNLARVEYYCSDFLSRLESRPRSDQVDDERLRKDSEIELEIPMPGGASAPRVFPGYNLLFAGTMNEDESTQSLSEKVVDRANVLRFPAPQKIRVAKAADGLPAPRALTRTRWSRWVRQPEHLGSERRLVEDYIESLVNLMSGLRRPFGHRLGLAMISYAANYPVLDGGHDPRVPMADQVEMRLLPKLRGVDADAFDREIRTLADFVGDDLSDSDLAKAIEDSLEVAKSGTGSFLWRGVTRT
ncbi:MAG: chromosome segregation ATPase-like protein, partial [Rhodobacteraceae bacterium]|nr:chromosome segregation ATPase-like protein [Paracoccaceae bacterium]